MEEIKENKGRGGRRPGAGRPRLELREESSRAVSRTITLTVEEWELLKSHSPDGSYSTAISGALELALDSRSNPSNWLPVKNVFVGPGPVRASDLTK